MFPFRVQEVILTLDFEKISVRAQTSKYKPITAKYELGLDAEVYSRLLETVVFSLKKKYDQSHDFEDFLEETRGTSMILTIDLSTDLHSITEAFDKRIID